MNTGVKLNAHVPVSVDNDNIYTNNITNISSQNLIMK